MSIRCAVYYVCDIHSGFDTMYHGCVYGMFCTVRFDWEVDSGGTSEVSRSWMSPFFF